MRKTAFIGHRHIFAKDISERLIKAIKEQIALGCNNFTMGTHGKFDELSLSVCRSLRNSYPKIEIDVVHTNLTEIARKADGYFRYWDVNNVIYEIETAHYKRRISESNKKMIEESDTLICYVDIKSVNSGAKTAMHYAEKRGLKIINLYRETDNPYINISNEDINDILKKM